jgi:hypothetical protein
VSPAQLRAMRRRREREEAEASVDAEGRRAEWLLRVMGEDPDADDDLPWLPEDPDGQ